jgi:ribosomal protein L14E/L6E/L27E
MTTMVIVDFIDEEFFYISDSKQRGGGKEET